MAADAKSIVIDLNQLSGLSAESRRVVNIAIDVIEDQARVLQRITDRAESILRDRRQIAAEADRDRAAETKRREDEGHGGRWGG